MTPLEGDHSDPRPGHPTVIVETNSEWPGGSATERYQYDAAWWDALSVEAQQHELAEIAVEHLAHYASSGASVIGRTDGTSSDDEPEDNR